ncbi:MAG: tRNA lysidine(34) synthetase TilS [Gammaproteobacteria bacterium]|nr:tRNA lysidine(34) synthetase TilS [Gammaproteobacteria bacterium]
MIPIRLLETLQTYPATGAYWLAYSGGRDSHVLLHLLAGLGARLPARLTAVHINHGLQPEADDWDAHCRTVCGELQVPFESIALRLSPVPGKSLEALARNARYQALTDLMNSGDVLLTAHHQGDQAETILLQLLRGAGPAGLSAMPGLTALDPGYLGRPLLGVSTEALASYAALHRLQWIEDVSNLDERFDRNFLRSRVIPVLRQRWPALSRTLSRSASHCGEAQSLVERVADDGLARLMDKTTASLAIPGLSELPMPEIRVILRHWIKSLGFLVPDAGRIDEMIRETTLAAPDRHPLIRWPGAEVRRYRRRLFIRPPLPAFDNRTVLPWNGELPLQLPASLGQLHAVSDTKGIMPSFWQSAAIDVRFRHKGESLRVAGRNNSRSFKKLFQEHGVPPWLRDRIPLVYLDGKLAAIADLCTLEPFAAVHGTPGVVIRWQGHGLRELSSKQRMKPLNPGV